MPKIEELYAFISYDKDDPTDEGIIGMTMGGGWMPFFGADMKRVDSLRVHADLVSKISGKPYRILHFKLVGEIK